MLTGGEVGMSDREKVINCIKYCINHPLCIDCDACDYGGESSVICDRLIQDTLALLKEQPQWVSVKDRMPEQAGKRCLVCAKYGNNKNAVFIAWIGYGSGEWETYDCLYMAKVRSPRDNKVYPSYVITHWMPLPEPPKEVSE